MGYTSREERHPGAQFPVQGTTSCFSLGNPGAGARFKQETQLSFSTAAAEL